MELAAIPVIGRIYVRSFRRFLNQTAILVLVMVPVFVNHFDYYQTTLPLLV